MNIIKLFFVALLLPGMVQAQTIKEGKVKIGKTKAMGFTATYDHPKDVTINAVENNIANAKLERTSKKKGYSIYKGAEWKAISSGKNDYYYKAKGKKGQTILTFAAAKPNGAYITTASDPQTAASIVVWLQNLEKQIVTGKIEKSEFNKPGPSNTSLPAYEASDPKISQDKNLKILKDAQQHAPLPVK